MIAYLQCLVNIKDDTSFRRTINTPKRGIGSFKEISWKIHILAKKMLKQMEALRSQKSGSLLELVLNYEAQKDNKRLNSAMLNLQTLWKDLKKQSESAMKPVELLHYIIQQTNWKIGESMLLSSFLLMV
jgi:superfamily I DNA/RNA helicase